MNDQKRCAIELAHRFKRRYDAQMLQAKIDYMASLYAPCVLAVVGDEVYAYNSDSAALLAHGFKAVYYLSSRLDRTIRQRTMVRESEYELQDGKKYGFCYHYNEDVCKCKHTGTKGSYWLATPLADGTIELTEVKRS